MSLHSSSSSTPVSPPSSPVPVGCEEELSLEDDHCDFCLHHQARTSSSECICQQLYNLYCVAFLGYSPLSVSDRCFDCGESECVCE